MDRDEKAFDDGTMDGAEAEGDGVEETEFDERAAKVHTRVLDVIRGYEELAERAEPDLKPLVERMLMLHRAHHDQLHILLESRGHPPDERGSFMSIIQENVMRVRSWFDDMDRDLIPQIKMGEEQLMELYDQAIETGPAGDLDRGTLEAQREALAREVAHMA